jgi:hypothetical protein
MSSLSCTQNNRFAGPPSGFLASIFTVLFLSGLYTVTIFGGMPHFPNPWESADNIAAFFQARPAAALTCAILQFGAAIPLGLFTVSIVSQLQSLGVRTAGLYIALFGGLATSVNMMISTLILWVMTYPDIAQNTALTRALYYQSYAFGGPGYSVPLGLLFAGVSIYAGFHKLLPRWIVILGIVSAIFGELSWLNLIFPQALFLIPLTRFPGFIWMIATGFALSKKQMTPVREPGVS